MKVDENMKKFLMPLVVLVIAAVISAVLYFARIEIHKDWQTTIGTVTKVEVRQRKIGSPFRNPFTVNICKSPCIFYRIGV